MGVNMNIQVVRGYYLTEPQIKSANLTDEDMDELGSDMENVHWVSSMTNGDVIFGKLLMQSPDGRYEPMDIPMTNLKSLILSSELEYSDRDILRECVPEKLQDVVMRVKPGCEFHLYTNYH